MSDINAKILYDALRAVGVDIPELPTVAAPLRRSVVSSDDRTYWHFTSGAFETFVDPWDAKTYEDALTVALSPLHPWYAVDNFSEATPKVEELGRDEYVDWLRKVKS